jgi:hypothetical protein
MRTISVRQRRQLMVRRHHLAGEADAPETVTRALIALHATDPASVYLSVLARSSRSTLADVAQALYERRSLVRWMAMRRTLFVFPREDVPLIQAAVSSPLAAVLRKRLISTLERNGAEPPVTGDIGDWLDTLASRVEHALRTRGEATGAELSTDVPLLRTAIPVLAPSDRPQNVTTSLLTWMSAAGRLVRSTPTGTWTSRHHRWEHASQWWPNGLPSMDADEARQALARRYLTRFGPATVDDLEWWTGWNKTAVRRALDSLPVNEVDLHGQPGITLRAAHGAPNDEPDEPLSGNGDAEPQAASLLPALDPTPMGWKHRDWMLGIDHRAVFDGAGNIGPTVWWNGEVIGSWAITAAGELRTRILADRGSDAVAAVDTAAARLHERVDGACVTPAVRTPLERSISDTT